MPLSILSGRCGRHRPPRWSSFRRPARRRGFAFGPSAAARQFPRTGSRRGGGLRHGFDGVEIHRGGASARTRTGGVSMAGETAALEVERLKG